MPLSLVFLILNPSSKQLREANQALKDANRELVELRTPRIQLENEREARFLLSIEALLQIYAQALPM